MNFFDHDDKFYGTSRVGIHPNRMNSRYRAIIESNLDVIRDRRVLALGSQEGRWAFAALKAGARHVTSIEAGARHVEAARQTFHDYGFAEDRYRFLVGDVCDVLTEVPIAVDTVLVLGGFFQTYRHLEIAALLAATGASHIVLDTALALGPERDRAVIQYCLEPTTNGGAAFGPRHRELIGRPSLRAIELMFGQVGFDLFERDWDVNADNPVGMADYFDGRRGIFLLKARDGAGAPGQGDNDDGDDSDYREG
jgi:hypothetical protein